MLDSDARIDDLEAEILTLDKEPDLYLFILSCIVDCVADKILQNLFGAGAVRGNIQIALHFRLDLIARRIF